MAPSPELGGQPKAPDKAGAEIPSTAAAAPGVGSPEAPPAAVGSSSSSSASQSLSGAKHSTVSTTNTATASVAGAAAAAATVSVSGSSGGSSTAAGATAAAVSQQTPQDSSKIDNMAESDLKALLEEAITYKCPKDREHKSATFNELLSKTEMEDQEQNFPFTSRPVQSKRASGRPTQGGSLQDLQEAGLHDYCYSEFPFANDCYANLGGLGVQTSRRHHGIGSSGVSYGPGGGDRAMNPRQKKYTSSVSSRQREGGSLPSNVNVEYPIFNEVGHHHTTGTITKIKKRESGSKSDYSAMLLTAPMTSAGAAELITTVAEVAGGTAFTSGMKNTESQLIDGCGGGIGGAHTVIDMGELEESDEKQHLLAHDALQQNLYDSVLEDFDGNSTDLYGSTSNSGGGSTTGGAGSGCGGLKKTPRFPTASYTSHAKLEIGEPSSTVRPSSVHHVDKTVSLPMLENKNVDITPIQLGSSYQSVKCIVPGDSSKSDQAKHVMMGMGINANNTKYITTQSFNQIISQKYLDENGNSVQQFGSSASSSAGGGGSGTGGNSGGGASGNNSSSLGGSGGTGTGSGGGKKSRKQPKSDRNTVLVIPENIEGYRGKDTDIESLVCYIENKDKQKEGKGSGGGGGNGTGGSGSGANPKNGTLLKVGASGNSAGNGNSTAGVENGLPEEKAPKKKGEKKKEKAKLKKSNSLEELSSCSRKKQQAEDEQNTTQRQPNNTVEQQSVSRVTAQEGAEPNVVTLRNNKANKKGQNGNSTGSSASSTTSSQSSKDTSTSTATGGKRGERRSWGTEELSFLEDRNQLGGSGNEKVEEKPSSKKESKKEAKDSAEAAIPTFNLTKKRDSLRMSVESLSAVSVSGTVETAEFHVVTKKKKMKKKSQSLFAEETGTATGSGANATNKRHAAVSQSYSMGSTGNSGRNANVTGRYQPSHNFTNDRDVYMNSLANSGNDVSRRKSTSSMPPSEKSDSSDADSVQSLPIEPTRKQQQQNSAAGHQPNRNQSGMVPQSYADIARIPNADKLNNNLLGNSTSNSTTSALDSSTGADRWPPVQATTSEDLAQALKSPSAFPELVPESSSSSLPQSQHQNQQQYQQQYVNNSVNSVSSNNLGNNNKATYSQSLLIAAVSTKATPAVEEERVTSGKPVVSSNVNSEPSINSGCTASTNSNSNSSSSSNSSTSSSSSKLALHKSKSVDNTDIYYSNEHYPALEKTVKSVKAGPLLTAAMNSTNLQEPKVSSVGKVSPVVATSAAGQFQNAPTYPTSMPVVVNSGPNQNALTGAKKSKKKDSTFLNTSASIATNEVETINNARNAASFQPALLDTINNNPVLIENVDENTIDYSQNNGLINRSPNGPVNLQQTHPPQSTPKTYASSNNSGIIPVSSTTSNVVVSSKRNKKEKSTSQSITQPQQSHGSQTLSHHSVPANTNAVVNSATTSNHRPAVIIMNDNNDSSGPEKHEFTFGFDIDQELLFGDFQEDDLSMIDQSPLLAQQQQYHQYHNQQKPSSHPLAQQNQQQPIYQHNNTDNNVPSPTSNTSAQSTDLGYSSMQQSSLSISSPSSSSSSSQHSQQQHQQPPPHQHHQHHYHNQSQHQPQPDTTYEASNNSTDPDTYRDSIEHKFHQPPPPMVLPPAPLYSQPPPQLPPPHVLAAHQQQQQQQQQQHHHHHHHQPRQTRPVNTTNHYNLPPPPVIPGHHHNIPQQQPLKQDSATNTSPAMVISANTAPAIMTVPPPPLPPAASGVAAPMPLVVAQPPNTVVLLPPVVISVNTNTAGYVSSHSNSNNNSPATAVSCNSSSSNNTTSLINQSTTSSGSSSSISSIASQQEPKPQRQQPTGGVSVPMPVQQQQQHQTPVAATGSTLSILREKVKEINLRFIAPEQLPTNHNHDKIVNFVGMAWEDIICGTNGSAKYYDGQ